MKTMKITRRLMGFAAALMALTACSDSEDMLSAFHNDPNAVRITAEVGKACRAWGVRFLCSLRSHGSMAVLQATKKIQ